MVRSRPRAVYKITAEGNAQESGVIAFAGLEMNVYQDQASNPCGDCPDQPVSIYVGTGTAETVESMAEAVRRADDLWEVTETTDSSLTLKEKTPGQCDGGTGTFSSGRTDAYGLFFR